MKPLPQPAPNALPRRREVADGRAATRVPFVVRRERGVINRSSTGSTTRGAAPRPTPPGTAGSSTASAAAAARSFGQGGLLATTADAPEFLAAGLRGRDRDVQHVPDAVQRRALRRDRDDGEGALHQRVRCARCTRSGRARRAARSSSTSSCRTTPASSTQRARSCRSPMRSRSRRASATADCSPTTTPSARGKALTPSAASRDQRPRGRPSTCALWDSSFLEGISPSDGCDDTIPKAKIYDAADESRRACGAISSTRTSTSSGVIRRPGSRSVPLDNVGVQYGLARAARQERSPSTSSST